MKSLFLSFITALGSLFGLNSHPAEISSSTPAIIVQTESSSSIMTMTIGTTTSIMASSSVPVFTLTNNPATQSSSSAVSQTGSSTNQSAINTDADQANLVITSPAGGDVLNAAQSYNILWKNEGVTPINFVFDLEYIALGLHIREKILGTVNSKQESFNFTVPWNAMPKTNYQIYAFDATTGRVLAGSQAFTIK